MYWRISTDSQLQYYRATTVWILNEKRPRARIDWTSWAVGPGNGSNLQLTGTKLAHADKWKIAFTGYTLTKGRDTETKWHQSSMDKLQQFSITNSYYAPTDTWRITNPMQVSSTKHKHRFTITIGTIKISEYSPNEQWSREPVCRWGNWSIVEIDAGEDW
jgi:hypothetical protein